MRYMLSDWTDKQTNTWRLWIGFLVLVSPSLAVWLSAWWLAVFYTVLLLPHLGRNTRVKKFKTLADLKEFVQALSADHEGKP